MLASNQRLEYEKYLRSEIGSLKDIPSKPLFDHCPPAKSTRVAVQSIICMMLILSKTPGLIFGPETNDGTLTPPSAEPPFAPLSGHALP